MPTYDRDPLVHGRPRIDLLSLRLVRFADEPVPPKVFGADGPALTDVAGVGARPAAASPARLVAAPAGRS